MNAEEMNAVGLVEIHPVASVSGDEAEAPVSLKADPKPEIAPDVTAVVSASEGTAALSAPDVTAVVTAPEVAPVQESLLYQPPAEPLPEHIPSVSVPEHIPSVSVSSPEPRLNPQVESPIAHTHPLSVPTDLRTDTLDRR